MQQSQPTSVILKQCLVEAGIKPSSFAYFLSCYVKQNPSYNKTALSILLSAQLQKEAELIHYHLTT